MCVAPGNLHAGLLAHVQLDRCLFGRGGDVVDNLLGIHLGCVTPVSYTHLDVYKRQRLKYQERRDALCDGLEGLGWERPTAHGSMFVWAKLPGGRTDSMAFCEELMEKACLLYTSRCV